MMSDHLNFLHKRTSANGFFSPEMVLRLTFLKRYNVIMGSYMGLKTLSESYRPPINSVLVR